MPVPESKKGTLAMHQRRVYLAVAEDFEAVVVSSQPCNRACENM
jgi:hypothetical protein